MGSCIILAGPYDALNFLAKSTSIAGNTNFGSTFSSLFPIGNISNGEPGIPARLAVASDSTQTIGVDLNRCQNGGFETWTRTNVPDNWINKSIDSGEVLQETSLVNSGSSALELNSPSAPPANIAAVEQRIKMIPGDDFTVSVALRNGSASSGISAYLYNSTTGRFLNSSGSWVTTATAFHSRTTASYSTVSVDGTVEDFATCQAGSVDLVFYIECQGSGNAYADDARLWPHWNFSAVFGHNLLDTATVTVNSDDNTGFSSPTTQITYATPRDKKAFYGITAGSLVTERYVQLSITGPQSNAPEIGEWVIGRATQPVSGIRVPFRISYSTGTSGGVIRPTAVNEIESAGIEIKVPWMDKATLDAFNLNVGKSTRWGGRTSILVPVGPDNLINPALLGSKPDIYIGQLMLNDLSVDHASNYEISGSMRELEYANHVK